MSHDADKSFLPVIDKLKSVRSPIHLSKPAQILYRILKVVACAAFMTKSAIVTSIFVRNQSDSVAACDRRRPRIVGGVRPRSIYKQHTAIEIRENKEISRPGYKV